MPTVNIRGRRGNVNARRGNMDTLSHTNLQPTSSYAEDILFISQLQDKTDNELFDIAFSNLKYSTYGQPIIDRFRLNNGEPLQFTMREWVDDYFSGKSDFFAAIEREIINHHSSFHSYSSEIDVSNAIRDNMPSFRFAPFNLSEMIAIGGIQEIEVRGTWHNKEEFPYGFIFAEKGVISPFPHLVSFRLRVLLKDWFGVDEGDFTNHRVAALLDRRGLTALWVLQHQRNYKPFISIFNYEFNMSLSLGSVCIR